MRKLLLIATVLVVVSVALPAGAYRPSQERAVAAALAAYCINEAGWDSKADCLLIWQAAETHASSLEGRLRWLRSHSRCALAEDPRQGCRNPWTRDLNPDGHEPLYWPERASWPLHRPAYFEILRFSLRVVRGEVTERPCAEPPHTWDQRTEEAIEAAQRRGFRALDCRDPWTGEPTLNEGFQW